LRLGRQGNRDAKKATGATGSAKGIATDHSFTRPRRSVSSPTDVIDGTASWSQFSFKPSSGLQRYWASSTRVIELGLAGQHGELSNDLPARSCPRHGRTGAEKADDVATVSTKLIPSSRGSTNDPDTRHVTVASGTDSIPAPPRTRDCTVRHGVIFQRRQRAALQACWPNLRAARMTGSCVRTRRSRRLSYCSFATFAPTRATWSKVVGCNRCEVGV
jgi:hypothetical protein